MLEQTVAENAWRIEEGLYRILLPMRWAVPFVSVYLVESGGQRMLIDVGLSGETSLRALGRALKAIGVPDGALDIILLTHRHPDHAGGAGPVQRRWGGKVLLHPDGIPAPSDGEEESAAWARLQGVPGEVVRAFSGFRPNGDIELGDALTPLDPGRTIELGQLSFEVIEVPGHCPGQVMLYERRRRWLFSADQVVEPEAPNVWMSPGVTGDPLGGYLVSLRRTAEIEATLVLPSHGVPLRGGLREFCLRQIRFQEEYLGRVEALVARHGASTWQVAQRLEPTRRDPSVLAEVLAALTHLEARGLVKRSPEGIWSPTRA